MRHFTFLLATTLLLTATTADAHAAAAAVLLDRRPQQPGRSEQPGPGPDRESGRTSALLRAGDPPPLHLGPDYPAGNAE